MKAKAVNNSDKLVNPLAKARGLGSSHHGADQWLMERVSAALLLPAVIWLVWLVVHMDHDYLSFTTWLHQPVNAILMILTVLPLFYHAAYGVQVVIEDYAHGHMTKLLSTLGVKLLSGAAAIPASSPSLKLLLLARFT